MAEYMSYLPDILHGIKEYQELGKAADAQLEELEGAIDRVEQNQYIETADAPSIARREKIFGIVADPVVESLDFRKQRLLGRLRDNPPYVDEYLKLLLDELTNSTSTRVIPNQDLLELEVLIPLASAAQLAEARNLLERVVPLNVQYFESILVASVLKKIHERLYTFRVPYPICNRERMAPMPGRFYRHSVDLAAKNYTFGVKYPTCGAYRIGNRTSLFKDRIGVRTKTSAAEVRYHRAGETIAGEATL